MPLQLPDLDDRRYDDLVAEALALIPTYAPQWTNHNPSDPGITLIELFAYLTDILMYRLNRVTDENKRKFLKLLTGPGGSSAALEGKDIREAIRDAVLGIRERYRAVTKDDYEFLAKDSYNKDFIENMMKAMEKLLLLPFFSPPPPIARAHCIPQKDLEKDPPVSPPDHVSVVIVPRGHDGNRTPQPSGELISDLKSYLDERRLITTKVHVVGPAYAYVSAQLVIGRKSDAANKDVEPRVEAALKALLDPLSWSFGRNVFVSDVYATLEKVQGVDFITDVMLESRNKPYSEDRSQPTEAGRNIWHPEGHLVGLSIKDRDLPVFDRAQIVIAPGTAFVMVNLSLEVTPKSQLQPDQLDGLKRDIKLKVRDLFCPALGQFDSSGTRQIGFYVDDTRGSIESSLKTIQDIHSVKVMGVDCVPSDIKKPDGAKEYIEVPQNHVVDWRVTTLTILPASQPSGGQM